MSSGCLSDFFERRDNFVGVPVDLDLREDAAHMTTCSLTNVVR